MQKKSVLIMLASFMFFTQTCYALTVFDPTNYGANLETKLQAIKQVQQQAQQLQNELKMLQKLDSSNKDATTEKIRDCVAEMNKIREETNAIGTDFATMTKEFDELRPDYEKWNGVKAEKYAEQTDKLRKAWEKSVEQSMKSQGLLTSPTEQKKTSELVENLVNASQNAEGTTGAIQALTQLTAVMVNELQKTETLMADAGRTQNLYQQKMIDAEKANRKISEEWADVKYTNPKAEIKDNGSALGKFEE